MKLLPALILAALLTTACDDDETTAANLPSPMTLSEEAAGYYCQMVILEHDGPKGQIWLEGMLAPLWFSQVRDALAYLKSPEQEGVVLVAYVNDMGAAVSWSEPGSDNWMNAKDAHYVVGSDAIGGMGAPELAPFSDLALAQQFAASHGGEVLRFDEISAETVLSPVEFSLAPAEIDE